MNSKVIQRNLFAKGIQCTDSWQQEEILARLAASASNVRLRKKIILKKFKKIIIMKKILIEISREEQTLFHWATESATPEIKNIVDPITHSASLSWRV